MEKEDILNLEDFIPAYPYLETNENESTEPEFYYPYEDKYEFSNFNKQEFYENLLDIIEERPEQKGIALKHQEFLARFLSPKTLNNEILLFHQVGTGKTCSAINIAELAMSMNPNLKILVLVKGDTFIKNFINELAFQCTPGQYIPENYSKLTAKEKVIRLNKNIRSRYKISTFYKFAQQITKESDKNIEKFYSNYVIIIDEVHNIKNIEKKKEEGSVYVYKQLHRFLHIVKNKKVVLLSATPMKDNITEFASIMNLILPMDLQLPIKKDFNKTFFTKGDNDGGSGNSSEDKIINVEILKKYIRGRVSFLRAMESQVTKTNIGKTINKLKYTIVEDDTMSKFQTEVYEKALRKDGSVATVEVLKNTSEDEIIGTPEGDSESDSESEGEGEGEEGEGEKEDKRGLYDNSRQASLFVFPDGTYGREGFNNSDNITMKSEEIDVEKEMGKKDSKDSKVKKPQFTKKLKDTITKNGTLTSVTDILNEIGKYSSKYKKALQEIVLHPKENCFVYSQFYKGSGLVIFAELLKLLGYKEAKGDWSGDSSEDFTKQEDQVLRFAILAEKITNKFENNIKTFNKPENRHGKYIQVLLGSPLVSEGRSFFNVRQIHILTPHWNTSLTEQVTGRGIRAFSHKDLDEGERYVKVYRHCSMPYSKNIMSIDYLMYEISETKDLKIKQIERVCKETAVDCALNKKRNLLAIDKDNTRECEYQNCNYVCDNVSDEYIQKKLEGMFKDKMILDTYNLYYGEKLVQSTINMIQQLFKRNFIIHIKDLMRHFGDLSFILLIRCLKLMIQNNIPIINKYGFVCYLKYERNLFFLTDNIQSPNSYFVNYYCENPPVYSTTKFKSIILENQSNNIQNITNYINSLDINNKDDLKKANELLFELNSEIQEELIEMSLFSKMIDPNKKLNIREVCLKLFNPNIIELKDMYVSVHLIEESKYRYILKSSKNIEEWDYADDNVMEKLKEKEKEKIVENKYIEDNPFGYYGYITLKNQKFKIRQTEKAIIAEKGSEVMKEGTNQLDKRKIGEGAVCLEITPSKKILDIILKMYKKTDYFNVPQDEELDTMEVMRNLLIKKAKYTEKELDKYNEEDIKVAYYWYSKYDKPKICQNIRTFFEKNNILQYEK